MENIKPLSSSDVKDIIAKYSPFLKEVRRRLIFTLIFFATVMVAGFVFYEKIISFLIHLMNLKGINIVFTSPFQFINLAISCGIATGIILTSPVLVSQILFFLKPALSKKEYKTVTTLLPVSSVLFLVGAAFGSLVMKWQIDLFLARSIALGIGNILDISNLLTTVLLTAAIMGLSFQLPIILYLLMRIRLIKPAQLGKARTWVYFFSFVFAVLLPIDSILADILLTLPLIVLFELTLFFGRVSIKK